MLLCPLSVHKHEFIVHSRFTMINRWSKVHHDISLQRTSLQRYIMVIIYRFALRDIVAANSRWTDISARYREDCTDILRIYHFRVRQSVQFIADISARNRENKARYSSIIVCITFAQYCKLHTKLLLYSGFVKSFNSSEERIISFERTKTNHDKLPRENNS